MSGVCSAEAPGVARYAFLPYDLLNTLSNLMNQFVWQPGRGMDSAALARLCKQFPRPEEPMGEAWFMGGDRRIYHELKGDLDTLDVQLLVEVLREISGGNTSFGSFQEWTEWFHYLLGRLLPRAHEEFVAPLLESLMTSFFAVYLDGIAEPPYKGFEVDVMDTLGQCMMEPQCWSGKDVMLPSLRRNSYGHPERCWFDRDASGDLSASLFFCLKYLTHEQIGGWLQSVLDIDAPVWRVQVMTWLVGAHGMLSGEVRWPEEFKIGASPGIDWEWSHCLRPSLDIHHRSASAMPVAFLPHANRSKALTYLHTYFTEDRFLNWLSGIDSDPALSQSLYDMPDTFEKLYVRSDMGIPSNA
jgi:hypothetical protein